MMEVEERGYPQQTGERHDTYFLFGVFLHSLNCLAASSLLLL